MSYDSYLEKVKKAIPIAEISSLKRVEGLVKLRVHNKGRNSEDTQIGTYSPGWAKVRRSRGKQVNFVDLQFEGDLIRGYSVGIHEGDNAFGFTSELEKRAKMEAKYGPVFFLTQAEKEQMLKTYNQEIKIQLNA
jgi:hypothetical protein